MIRGSLAIINFFRLRKIVDYFSGNKKTLTQRKNPGRIRSFNLPTLLQKIGLVRCNPKSPIFPLIGFRCHFTEGGNIKEEMSDARAIH